MDTNIKKLSESILSDITSDVSIVNILLKTKVLAARKQDKELLTWVTYELNGYSEAPPAYRIIDAGVKVDINRGFQQVMGFTYPIDMVKDEKIRDRISHIKIYNPITEIEEMCKRDDSESIHVNLPTWIWYHHMGHCINGNIERAYQFCNLYALRNILVSVKSLLIDYFLKLANDEDIQFNSLIKNEKAMTVNNINASIVNTGDGTINADHITTVIGNGNTITQEEQKNLQDLLKKIDDLMRSLDNDDYKEIFTEIALELKKEEPSKKFIKICIQAIGGLVNGIASGVIANQITPYISAALALL